MDGSRTRLSKGQSKEPRAVVTDIVQACLLLGELDNVMQNQGVREVIQGLHAGLNHALAYKKPGLACAFLYHYLNSVHYTKQAVSMKDVLDDLKDITAVEGKPDFPTFPD